MDFQFLNGKVKMMLLFTSWKSPQSNTGNKIGCMNSTFNKKETSITLNYSLWGNAVEVKQGRGRNPDMILGVWTSQRKLARCSSPKWRTHPEGHNQPFLTWDNGDIVSRVIARVLRTSFDAKNSQGCQAVSQVEERDAVLRAAPLNLYWLGISKS